MTESQSNTTAPAAEAPASVAPATAYVLAATAMIIYSSPPSVTRAVTESVPPLALSLSRWVIAFAILLPFALPKLRAEWPQIKRHWLSLTLIVLPMIFGSTMSVLAVYYTTATNAVLVNASQPALTAMLSWVIVGVVLTGRQKVGIVCALLGIVVMISRADLAVLTSLEFNVGDFIMLLAVLGWSLYAVLFGRASYAPHGVLLMLLISVIGSVMLLPAALIERAAIGGFEYGLDVIGAMFFLAIFPTILATVCWNVAIRSIGANRTAIFVNLIPVSGAALAMLILGERLFVYHIVGAAFVLAGIWLAVRRG